MLLWFAISANSQSFDAASVKTSTSPGLSCNGGPGSGSPGLWRCTGMPLGLVISRAFDFPMFQFSPKDPCCSSRFDFDVRYPEGATRGQFDQMLQNLLRERFHLAFHFQPRNLAIYRLTADPKGMKLKTSLREAKGQVEEPWWTGSAPAGGVDKDGYPEFPPGSSGLTGLDGHYRWTAYRVSAPEMARTLQDHLARPVVDATGLKGTYDVDLKWTEDRLWQLSTDRKAEIEEQVGRPLETVSGPTLLHGIQAQLGLRLVSQKGRAQIVVIDHVDKTPGGN